MKILVILLSLLSSEWTTEGVSGRKMDRSRINSTLIPDSKKNTADLCEKWGYPAEQHIVTTEDGYILTIFRVPRGVKNVRKTGRVPVILQHGIYLNSDSWVLRGAHDLPFLLAESGYDVWMTNSRGTDYSIHWKYPITHSKFWDYSIDEIALYDLPAMIDYILGETGHPSLVYSGHSRGGNVPIMLLSARPEYNQKVHMLQLLSPVLYSKYAKSPFYEIAGNRPYALMSQDGFRKMINLGLPTLLTMPKFLVPFLQGFCSSGTMLDRICPMFFFFINGEDFANFDYSLIRQMLGHFTLGVSSKEALHLIQISNSDEYKMFDYGRNGNLRNYNRPTPPFYNISAVTQPVYVYWGQNDLFLSYRDLKKFIKQLPNFRKLFKVPYPKFNHLDYIWGKNTNKLLFPTYLKDINDFHNTNFNHTGVHYG